ncbi:protein N-terminal glutamine amidohydrolase-like [Mya arenaria]|uniref:protein N-terminal glutamine amidohydrolase-like n=1 Tax=Mya arenaria TaxID=6604 RepID=UPI0022E8AD48|nr:protein N-terminal glutamine amidohydrolase-like [Mya arenaria]
MEVREEMSKVELQPCYHPLFSEQSSVIYTNCYCEENVWQLCNTVKSRFSDELCRCYCVFISNKEKQIPLWLQKAGKNEEGLVVWDYHVILLHKMASGSFVYDLDSRLSFPVRFEEYAFRTIHPCSTLKPQFRRRFRVVAASTFLATFASDRSHMLDDEGRYLKPPPDYPPIRTEASENNIQEFISMDPAVGVGNVMDFEHFYQLFTENNT